MKRKYLLLIIALLSLSSYAQDGEMRGLVNTDSFPQVSFIWHEYNPNSLKAPAFELQENNVPMDIKVINKQPAYREDEVARSIVILWEDMYCNGDMYHFFRQTLLDFVDSARIDENKDYVYIAAFNRHHNYENVLKPITKGFISSRSQLKEDIRNYRRSTDTYSELPALSDIYPAILEALNLLQKRDVDEVKGVFVLTAGRPLESSATNSAVEVQKRAKEMHIPLYMFQYAVTHGKSSVLEGLGKDTYGSSVVFDGDYYNINVQYAASRLNIGYRYLPLHYYGQDYIISYNSNQKRGGKEVELNLKVNSHSYSITMRPAKHNFWSWCKAYWYISILILLIVVGSAVLIIVYVQKQKNQHTADSEALSRLKEEHAQSQKKMQNQLDEQAARIKEYKEKAQREGHKADTQSLLELMQKKNIFPRIQYTDKQNNMFVYEMRKPEILIGRSSDADLKLDDPTVSRKHATIRFAGGGFEITDLGSINGTIVAGRLVQGDVILNDHDIINMGNVLLTFCL